MAGTLAPFLLKPFFSPRPWGRANLQPWYSQAEVGDSAEPIGESWLTGPQSEALEGPEAGRTLAQVAQENTEALLGEWRGENEFPLLLKLLFPDEKLSVQVHPDDEQARAMGQPRGKTECWYVVDAEPGAAVACGLRAGVDPQQMHAAATDGTMESLLRYIPVQRGDMVFVDAGTVHAIGPGVTLLETQQTSDTTFRLYDYGRPRELHLDKGVAVSRAETRAGKVEPVLIANGERLIEEQYFTVDRFVLRAGETLRLEDAVGRPHCFTTLQGNGIVSSEAGAGTLRFAGATVVPASAGAVTVEAMEDLVVVRSMPSRVPVAPSHGRAL
ncbi:type I phosphomannose isomerase catalytic subunit [Terriglobus aquaticus]|uniref:Type I phosphomannose isomerase catalytic subunit n=1 Tax=Terriglobus aquaticus TaxID=940139 RepID=A0ABW9KL74_9BACT|nr:type I phosphomannose isomerase catalytic subunit [Terriglobus aquaticus]